MKLQELKALLLIIVGVSALLVASPALQRLLVYPQTEFFTEMGLLGSGHRAGNYPFNITLNENYRVYLGVENHLGSCAYYMVQVKFCDLNQSTPYNIDKTSNTLSSLYNITVFVEDKESWELPIVFSFDYTLNEDFSQIYYNHMIFNDVTLDLTGTSSEWNIQRSGFFGNLFFELWIFNGTTNNFQYHERCLDMKFNMTSLELAPHSSQ